MTAHNVEPQREPRVPFTERWMPPVTEPKETPVAAMPYETPTPRCRQAKNDERQRTFTYASRGGCACALERARLEPSNRHVAHAVGSRDICLRLARSKPLERFRPLIGCQLRRPSEPHPTGLRTLPSLPCTSKDQRALEPARAPAQRRSRLAALQPVAVVPAVGLGINQPSIGSAKVPLGIDVTKYSYKCNKFLRSG